MLTQDQIDSVPGQPDGIEDDSRDMPDPARAAERILAYVEAMGDGLYDVTDVTGSPLYGRDLCSVAQAVEKLIRERDSLARRCSVRFGELEEARAEARQARDERDKARAEAAQSDADHRVMDTRATELAEPGEREPEWLVWSVYHDAWWGPGQSGYHDDITRAGRYDRKTAEWICLDGGAKGYSADGKPSEVMVPAPDVEVVAAARRAIDDARQSVSAAIEQATRPAVDQPVSSSLTPEGNQL